MRRMNTSHSLLHFFSIIIPAHNEEKYIGDTLLHLSALDYPIKKYEVIVVENASRDNTYKKAKEFEKDNISVFGIPGKGVSAAKNFGATQASTHADWVIFLDADTLLKKNFLHDLNDFLIAGKEADYSVGTTEVMPISGGMAAKAWFAFYNLSHKLTKTSFSLQVIDRPLLDHIHFHEQLEMGEDLKFILEARAHGNFFYFPTKE